MADNKNENQQSQAMLGSYDANGNYVDPYGVTFYDGFTGKDLNNADTEKSAYGDDSTLATYNTGNNKGGTNDKYTGENTLNTYTGYNADIKTADLNPDYQYGGLAQQQESIDNSYIANRNDNIASALYNEGKTSIEDVANYLNQQQGFQNSTAEQRQNTINSVWKRIGQIEAQNQQSNEQPAEPSNTPQEENNEALNNMESDLNQSTAGKIYGKVTANESAVVNTLEDENSVYRSMNASRIQTFKNLQAMDSNSIASAIISGVMATDTQAMRDLMQYDPAKYQEVKQAEKQIRGQININAITSGEGDFNTVATNGQSGISNDITDFALNSSNGVTSTADILKSVNQTLSSNQSAATASEQMATIEGDMATLQNRLKNLKKEANTVFKGDVPQYIVNAYVANRTAEIQDQLSILENRYNAAQSRYQQEWEQTKWNAEFELKKEELQLKRESAVIDNWAAQQGIMQEWAKINGTVNGTTTTTQLTQQEAQTIFQNFVSSYKTGATGGQCGAFVKKYLSQLGVSLPNISSLDAKKSLINPSITAPTEGDLVIMSSKNYPQNGHIAIVESVDDDGTMHILESNWGGDEKVHRRTVKPGDSSILGYYSPFASTADITESPDIANGTWTRKDGTQFDIGNSMLFNSLSENDRNTVLGLLNLSIDPTTLQTRYGYDKGQAQKLINAAIDINPSWTDGDKKAAQMAYQAWNKDVQQQGKSKNGTAISTAFDVIDLADKIGNGKRKDWNSMINVMKDKLSDEEFIELNSNIYLLASEYAGALKGTASPTNQDIAEAKQIIASNFSSGGMKSAAKSIIKALYNKNANEASNYYQVVLTKPDMLVTPRVAERMADMGLDMTIYGDYKPSGTWNKTAGGYAPKFGEETYNVSSIGDLLNN